MMTTKVHFLKGTTFSNVLKRRDYSPEKKATLAFYDFSKFLAVHVGLYNATKHSALDKSPNEAWDCYFANNPGPEEISQSEINDFRIDFFPQEVKKIHPYGIEILGRRYYGSVLKDMVGKKILVKYDPYDLGHLYGLIDDRYEEIPLSYDPKSRSNDYELYRYQRTQRGLRNGTITEDEALAAMVESEVDLEVAQKKTLDAKARRKLEAERNHKETKRKVVTAAEVDGEDLPKGEILITNVFNYLDFSSRRAEEADEIDFNARPTIYEGELK